MQQATGDTTYWSDVKVGLPGMAAVWAGGTTLPLHAPQQRTEYFTPSGSEGLTWTTLMRRDLGTTSGTAYDGPRAVRQGASTAHWYKSPYGPVRNTYSPALMTRNSNRLTFTIAPFGDAGGHDSTIARLDSGTRQLLVNGEPQAQVSGIYELPREQADVTFRQSWQRPATGIDRTGLAYSTEWNFRSGAADQGAQRLLVPVLDLPSDLRNSRPAGEATTIGVGAVVDGADGPVALQDARVEYAYGEQATTAAVTDWHPARMKRSHGTWQAVVPGDVPAGTFVHLRVTLADGQGARVGQTMVRAYEVR